MAYASLTDLTPLLFQTLTSQQQTRATQLLEQAASRINAFTRRRFDLVTNDIWTGRATGGRIRLPQTPVISISAVQMIDYLGRHWPLPVFGFDGIDTLDLSTYDVVLNLPAIAADGTWTGSVQVTYTHGYSPVPAEIIELNAELVARVFNSPTQGVPGMLSQNVGPYGVRLDGSSPAGQGVVALTEDDKALLMKYRRSQASVETR